MLSFFRLYWWIIVWKYQISYDENIEVLKMGRDLNIIKKKYGEDMVKLC